MLRRTTGLAVAAGVLCLLLLIPGPDPQVPASNGTQPFAWNRDAFWTLLETQFREARARGCEPLRQDIDREFALVRRLIGAIDNESVGPDDPRWVEIETSLFHVAPWVAACPERLLDETMLVTSVQGDRQATVGFQTMLVTSVRATVKRQSAHWDMDSSSAREQIYRLLCGGGGSAGEALQARQEWCRAS